MPPASRKQPTRTAPATTVSTFSSAVNGSGAASASSSRHTDAVLEFQKRRVQRRLDELERTNPTDIPAQSFVPSTSQLYTNPSASASALNASTIINVSTTQDVQMSGQAKKKISTNVRKVLYSRKGLGEWLDELPQNPAPPYISSTAPPSRTPPRKLCSSCGYFGAYRCPKCGEYSCDAVCLETHARDGGCGVGS